MISVYEDHAACIGQVQAEQGLACPTMYWNGAEYQIQPGGARTARKGSPGGFELDSDLGLTVLVSLFGQGPFPESQQNLYYPGQNGKKYRIESVTRAAGSKQLHLACNDAAQGI